MKTAGKKTRLGAALILSAAGAIAFSIPSRSIEPAGFVRVADAAPQRRVVEIHAKKFEFSPSEITLKKGEPVILRLSSEDRTHGFLVKPLGIDTDIAPGNPTDIAMTPASAGEYTIICDHYCGIGHGNMKMKLNVVE